MGRGGVLEQSWGVGRRSRGSPRTQMKGVGSGGGQGGAVWKALRDKEGGTGVIK